METLYKFVINDYRVYEHYDYCHFNVMPTPEITSEEPAILEVRPVNEKQREIWDRKSLILFGEDEYVKHYGNITSSVSHNRFTITITKDGDKVAIKLFQYIRSRSKGRKFFKIQTKVDYISFNTKTNNLYTGFIRNYHKKRKFSKSVRRNEFWSNPINRVISMANSITKDYSKTNPNLLLHKTDLIDDMVRIFFENIPNSKKYSGYSPNERLYKLYCDGAGIKTPNNWNIFLPHIYGINLKKLRKNRMKLIDTFMSEKGLYGDKVKKILHNVDKVGNLELYKWCNQFFGNSYINGKSEEFITDLIKSDEYANYRIKYGSIFSKKERNNIFEIINLVTKKEINMSTFIDHISMYTQIKNFEEVKWKSTTYEQFKDEHLQYTERVSFYTKGEFFRMYDEEFKSKIQEPIMDEYYPILLETSNDYNLESFVQSNCVKGYIDRPSSIIISLRKGNPDSKERATIDFSIDRIHHKMKLFRHQTLGRFNLPLTTEWVNPVQTLENRFRDLVNNNVFKLYNCRYKLGYNEYLSGVKFVDYTNWEGKDLEKLCWENKVFGSLGAPRLIEQELINEEEIIAEF